MAQLLVRNLDGTVKERLRARAARNGHSMEEEARTILTEAVADERAPSGIGSRLAARFRGIGFDEPLPKMRRRRAVSADFR